MINQGKKKIMSKKNLRIDLESWTFHIPSINIQSELEEPLLKLYHEYRSPLSALTLTANAKIFTSKNHFKQWIASHKQEEFHNWKVFHLSFLFSLKKSLSSMMELAVNLQVYIGM